MEPKSGVATSEFWGVVALVCGLLGGVLPATIKYVPEGSVGWVIISIVIAVAGSVMSYVKSRGVVKAVASGASDPLPPSVPPKP